MRFNSEGSALLVVMLLSAAFLLYASSMFWVNTLMRQGVEQQIKVAQVNAYADGLADYALALHLEGKFDAKNKKEMVLSSWPPGAAEGYSGKIIASEKCDGDYDDSHIVVELLHNDKIIQRIEYGIKREKCGYQIYDFKRMNSCS